MNTIDFFNIHGLVTIKVIQPRKATRFSNGLRAFDYFKVAHISTPPDIVVKIGEFTPDLRECYLVDHQYHIRPNYFFCTDHFKNKRWKIQIEGFEKGQTHIYLKTKNLGFKAILIADYFYQSFLLKQIISAHLRRKGYFLVSGAAISEGENAIVILGRGGACKTTLLMKFLKDNPEWQFLGDDLVILGNGKVLSFPVFPWLFHFRKKFMSNEEFGFFSRLKALFYFSVSRDKLDVNIINQSRIKLLLNCDRSFQTGITIQKTTLEDLTQRLYYGAQLEDASDWNMGFSDAFIRYTEAYNYVFPAHQLLPNRNDFNPKNIIGSDTPNAYQLNLPIHNINQGVREAVDIIKGKFFD